MKSLHCITTALTLALSTAVATPALAIDRPVREVHINAERLAVLDPKEQEAVLVTKSRLDELIATDRSTLTTGERAALRAEWKELKRDMRTHNARAGGNVIYISTAGLIIIILLLIILL